MQIGRRGFLSALLAPFLARFLPKPPVSEQFSPRYYSVGVAEDLAVLNQGDPQIIAVIAKRMEDAYREMSRLIAQEFYLNQQPRYSARLSQTQRVFDPSRLST